MELIRVSPTRRAFAASAAALAWVGRAGAQQPFPAKPVTMVVPFPAGGSTDIVGRLVAKSMGGAMGHNVIVENRGGAGGTVGANAVAKATPDGYTILLATVATHALNPSMGKGVPYDPVKDFAPISLLVIVPNVLVVNPSFPAKDVQELIAILKKEPGRYSYASSGNGTPLHLSGELFKTMAGVDMAHVPYRGSGPALIDVIGGQVPIMFDVLGSASGHIRSGKLRALAVTTAERVPTLPDVPTMAEAGLPGYETYTWNALFAPAGTAPDIVARLNAEANRAIMEPEIKARLAEIGAVVVGTTPEQLGDHVRAELAKWAPIIRATGAQVD